MKNAAPLILLSILAISCTDGVSPTDGGVTTDAGARTADAGSIDGSTDAGMVDGGIDVDEPYSSVTIQTFNSTNNLSGYFLDGPELQPRIEEQSMGSCKLMHFTLAPCTPACSFDELCVAGTCEPYANRVDKGLLLWTDPAGQTSVDADDTFFYNADSTVAAGVNTLQVDGETLEIDLSQNADFEVVGDWDANFAERDGDVVLSWSNPISGTTVRLAMTDCTGSHGGVGEYEIECEGPDTGELTIPGAFLDILDDGAWDRGECGSHRLERANGVSSADGTFRFESRRTRHLYYRPDF